MVVFGVPTGTIIFKKFEQFLENNLRIHTLEWVRPVFVFSHHGQDFSVHAFYSPELNFSSGHLLCGLNTHTATDRSH